MTEVKLSVAETNDLRLQLGLKPLNIHNKKYVDKFSGTNSISSKTLSRIQVSRKHRNLNATIGQDLLSERKKLSAKDWIARKKLHLSLKSLPSPVVKGGAVKVDNRVAANYPRVSTESEFDSKEKLGEEIDILKIPLSGNKTYKKLDSYLNSKMDPNYVELNMCQDYNQHQGSHANFKRRAKFVAHKIKTQIKIEKSLLDVRNFQSREIGLSLALPSKNIVNSEQSKIKKLIDKRIKPKQNDTNEVVNKHVFNQSFSKNLDKVFSQTTKITVRNGDEVQNKLEMKKNRRPKKFSLEMGDILKPSSDMLPNLFKRKRGEDDIFSAKSFNNNTIALTSQAKANAFEKIKFKFDLSYRDDEGNLLTPKAAYKYLSHKFHGKAPGRIKLEKLKKKALENQEQSINIDRSQHLDTKLKIIQKKIGTTYVRL